MRVVHILSNGKQVDSIEGRTVPAENAVYQVIKKGVLRNGNNRTDNFSHWNCSSRQH